MNGYIPHHRLNSSKMPHNVLYPSTKISSHIFSAPITTTIFKRFFTFYQPDVFLNFYNMLHPDYYDLYIRPLLTESVEDKMIRIATYKYHLAHLNHELYQMTGQNRIVLGCYVTYSITPIILLHLTYQLQRFPPPADPLGMTLYLAIMAIGAPIILSIKYLVLKEELYEHLMKSGYLGEFILNELPPSFI